MCNFFTKVFKRLKESRLISDKQKKKITNNKYYQDYYNDITTDILKFQIKNADTISTKLDKIIQSN